MISLLALAPLLFPAPLVTNTYLARGSQEPVPEETATSSVTHSSTLWIERKYEVQGSWRIEHRAKTDKSPALTQLILGANFKTEKGPDLKVVLSPQEASQIKSKNTLNGGLVLGVLSRYSGESTFNIPVGTDLSKFKSMAIHCEEYSVLWGTTPLATGQVLKSGASWTKKANRIRGHWEVAQVGKDLVLRLGEDFNTSSGPDLKLVFTKEELGTRTGENALTNATIVASLKDDEDAQAYNLGSALVLSDYKALLIHCEKYSKLWGGTSLR